MTNIFKQPLKFELLLTHDQKRRLEQLNDLYLLVWNTFAYQQTEYAKRTNLRHSMDDLRFHIETLEMKFDWIKTVPQFTDMIRRDFFERSKMFGINPSSTLPQTIVKHDSNFMLKFDRGVSVDPKNKTVMIPFVGDVKLKYIIMPDYKVKRLTIIRENDLWTVNFRKNK